MWSAPTPKGALSCASKITALEPPRRFEYWILTRGTRGQPERHVLRGWHAVLERLEEALGGQPADWEARTRDRVTELYFHYRNKPRA